MKKIYFQLLILVSVLSFFSLFFLKPIKALASDFYANAIISDGTFVNINAMSVGDIQNFLSDKGSFLKDYSENGRSAAQIIYDASHGYGEASGSANGIDINTSTGTVNPQVILVTLQKEQSLISRTSQNDNALRAAMGYGCPDGGGCNSKYAGFTNQVEWGSWQLRYNYERAYGHGFGDYQVGQTMHFYNTYPNPYGGPSEQDVHIDNRSTASLYRYTPHVYNGNYNFWYFFNRWFVQQQYDSEWVSQNSNPSLNPGQAYQFEVNIRNIGSETWTKDKIFLGTDRPIDRVSDLLREGDNQDIGWISSNRVQMVGDSVASGEIATFRFWLKASLSQPPIVDREYFRLVREGVAWMNDLGIYWDITILAPYNARWVSQNSYPTLGHLGSYQFEVVLRNTGYSTWTQDVVRLGTSHPQDRIPNFTEVSGWITSDRVQMVESSVAPGANGTFRFTYTVPVGISPGTYREYFRPVVDGIAWMNDLGLYWDVTVLPDLQAYKATWVSQNSYPTLATGQSYQFELVMKNDGGAIWTQGLVNLGTAKPFDRVSNFTRGSGWFSSNRIQMVESSVAPGANGTFRFTYTIPDGTSPGTYREYFRPVADGITWMNDWGIYWDIKVDYPHSQWVNQSSYPTLSPGGKTLVWIEFKNTGDTVWQKDSTHPIRLGTDRSRDRNSIFYYLDWLSANRIKLDQTSVNPGEIGRFSFNISIPEGTSPGTYREYFRPVCEWLNWMEDNNVYLDVTVK